jgi:hypothetical protein
LSRHPGTDSTTWLRGFGPSSTSAGGSSSRSSLSLATVSELAMSPRFSAREETRSLGGSTEACASNATTPPSASESIASTRRSHEDDNGAMVNVAPHQVIRWSRGRHRARSRHRPRSGGGRWCLRC